MTAKIKIENLHKSFGSKVVLDGVSVDVEKGESLVVIGGSGSGKSVLIKSILGIVHPDSGSIQVDGEEVTHLNKGSRDKFLSKFGMLFQGGALFDSLNVWENIAFKLIQNDKMNKKDAYDLAVLKLQQVGLNADVAKLSPAELSGGMQKRVALARAIAANPEIIFFDEPTTGLDPIMADVINDLIVKCSRELGATTITITHDMHSASKIGHNLAMIYKGKFIWHGKAGDIYNSGNEYVDQFVHGKAEGPIKMEIKK